MTEGKREKRSKHSDEGIVARLQDACGGMAFAEVARVTGVKPESARRYLIGSTPATVRFLRNLCVAYDLSFEWARKLMPGHPDPRMNLALTLEVAGRTDDAIAGYRTALEVYPDHIQSMQALARVQIRTSRTDVDTAHLLSEITMRGDTPKWREWARLQIAKAGK